MHMVKQVSWRGLRAQAGGLLATQVQGHHQEGMTERVTTRWARVMTKAKFMTERVGWSVAGLCFTYVPT